MMSDISGNTFGLWTVQCRDYKKRKTRDKRWICVCNCGTIKSVLEKNLKKGKSLSCGCQNKVDYTGKKFGKLTVLSTFYDKVGKGRATYKCQCECGNIIYVSRGAIGKQISCGCSRRNDLSNQKFGLLLVEKMLYKYNDNVTYCKCICDCGNHIIVRTSGLVSGNTTSCGCRRSPSLVGKTFGKLTVIQQTKSDTHQKAWLCECVCGNSISVHSYELTSGHTKSCGCLRSEATSSGEMFISHLLRKYAIPFKREHSFPDCCGYRGRKLRFDFYLPQHNILIEYDGLQHYTPIEYFGGEDGFKRLKDNDETKTQYCITHNIELLRIPYTFSKEKIQESIHNIIQNPVTTTAV